MLFRRGPKVEEVVEEAPPVDRLVLIQQELIGSPCPEHRRTSMASRAADGRIELAVCCDAQRTRAERIVAAVAG